ncbi:MAG: primosomal protein N' [Puniceicoccales bacterium]|jgi:primosomal protein N' (replication factor Y)|nr:primosomal protein N' [Puniceicoccales bacterium]
MSLLVAEVFILGASLRPLYYGIPEALQAHVQEGSIVQIPLRRRLVNGLVWRIMIPETDFTFEIRPITEMREHDWNLPLPLLRLIQWISKYYGASLGLCMNLAMPKAILRSKKKKTEEKFESEIIDPIRSVGAEVPVLSPEQEAAFYDLRNSYQQGQFTTHLLHGVTGSGKTEVYLRIMEEVLQDGHEVLYLVPELSLTPQTVSRIQKRFAGRQAVAVWHSSLSISERRQAWNDIVLKKTKIVVGARSALFLPQKDLRLIIVDEEHDTSYKQNENPRYHGRDVAIYKAFLHNALCILGSATPSMESFFNTRHKGFRYNVLPYRVDHRPLPTIRVVDMRHEINGRMPVLFSRLLLQKLEERLEKKEQSILFLNRRGYALSCLCISCDYVAACPHCSVSLTHHRSASTMKCHLCGHHESLPIICPRCGSRDLKLVGSGTQKVEDRLKAIFPTAKILRVDSDNTAQKNSSQDIWKQFQSQEWDILIGTQMISKGLDFPNVTLVGLLQGDLSLQVQDFRSNERTFQLISQVAGRAGRGEKEGEVVLQTFLPQSNIIRWAQHAQFEDFAGEELKLRQQFGYPPYRHIIRHLLRGKDATETAHWAESWGSFLQKHLPTAEIELRGPTSSSIEKIQNYYRYTLFFFVVNVSKALPILLQLREAFPWNVHVLDFWDADPVDMS